MKEFIKKNPPRFVFLVGLFMMLLLFGGFITYTALRDTVAMVGATKITKQDLEDKMYYTTGEEMNVTFLKKDATAQDYVAQLIEDELIRQKMNEQGITVSDEEALESLKLRILDFEERSERFKQIAIDSEKISLGKSKLEEKIVSWAEGEYLVYRTAQYLEVPTSDEAENPNVEVDEKKYEAERKYAQAMAKRHLEQIKSGELKFVEAKEELVNDNRIGEKAYPKNYVKPVGEINKKNYASNFHFFAMEEFRNPLETLEKGEVSNIIEIKVYPGGNTGDQGRVGYYILINIEDRKGGEYSTLEDWLNSNEVETKIYY
ncbi:MAG: SurA N-terminal domain-containing protein [Patescibacteria group bacterium]|nr:SurA N-terminal domain-containing protein [Patescibacteria group bacterium]